MKLLNAKRIEGNATRRGEKGKRNVLRMEDQAKAHRQLEMMVMIIMMTVMMMMTVLSLTKLS
jgi:hypothetical protein